MANPYPRSEETKRKMSEAHKKKWASMTEEERKARHKRTGKFIKKALAKMSEEQKAELNAKRSKGVMRYWRSRPKKEMQKFSKKMSKIATEVRANRSEEENIPMNRKLSAGCYYFWKNMPKKRRRKIELTRAETNSKRINKNFEFIQVPLDKIEKVHGVVISND